ncbi:hypothetical protein ACH5RR_023582 [Cinchona calisaya]|uniref:Uncharacterized protein n=1 Tax=Cinchona calisaya TaxID=153742 RepID=A0ABD2ZB30_9GENT
MSSSQNCPFVHHEKRKGDAFDTSIKTLKDARETITKDSNKEIEFDGHEQPVDLVDDTLEEMKVLVTGPSKFDVRSNVVHNSSRFLVRMPILPRTLKMGGMMQRIVNLGLKWKTPS